MYTLVVVDMQPNFNSANGKRVRENCLREVKAAVIAGADIIFLEFSFYGPSHSDLTEAAGKNYYVQSKTLDDGSAEVESQVRAKRLPVHFKVCGINTDCCVASTVRGLTARFPRSTIEVVADACASDWYHNRGLNDMKSLQGFVNVINL